MKDLVPQNPILQNGEQERIGVDISSFPYLSRDMRITEHYRGRIQGSLDVVFVDVDPMIFVENRYFLFRGFRFISGDVQVESDCYRFGDESVLTGPPRISVRFAYVHS